jgi:hypothetical protein
MIKKHKISLGKSLLVFALILGSYLFVYTTQRSSIATYTLETSNVSSGIVIAAPNLHYKNVKIKDQHNKTSGYYLLSDIDLNHEDSKELYTELKRHKITGFYPTSYGSSNPNKKPYLMLKFDIQTHSAPNLLQENYINEYNELLKQKAQDLQQSAEFFVNVQPQYLSLPLQATAPNDPLYPEQFSLNNNYGKHINIEPVWGQVSDASSIVVAITDTGVDYTHKDLIDSVWVNGGEIPDNGIDDDSNGYIDDVSGWDFTENAPSAIKQNEQQSGHGNLVSGIVGATSNNYEGISGVAWGVKLMPLYGFNSLSYYYACDNGADIVHASHYGLVRDATEYCLEKGALVSVAVGNSGVYEFEDRNVNNRAQNLPNVLTTGTYDIDQDRPSSRSSYGPKLDVLSPSKGKSTLVSSDGSHTYANFTANSGTSFSSPHTSGVAAMLKAAGVANYKDIITLVLAGASGNGDWDPKVGYGTINAEKSLNLKDSEAVLAGIRFPSNNRFVVNGYPLNWSVEGFYDQDSDANLKLFQHSIPVVIDALSYNKEIESYDLYIKEPESNDWELIENVKEYDTVNLHKEDVAYIDVLNIADKKGEYGLKLTVNLADGSTVERNSSFILEGNYESVPPNLTPTPSNGGGNQGGGSGGDDNYSSYIPENSLKQAYVLLDNDKPWPNGSIDEPFSSIEIALRYVDSGGVIYLVDNYVLDGPLVIDKSIVIKGLNGQKTFSITNYSFNCNDGESTCPAIYSTKALEVEGVDIVLNGFSSKVSSVFVLDGKWASLQLKDSVIRTSTESLCHEFFNATSCSFDAITALDYNAVKIYNSTLRGFRNQVLLNDTGRDTKKVLIVENSLFFSASEGSIKSTNLDSGYINDSLFFSHNYALNDTNSKSLKVRGNSFYSAGDVLQLNSTGHSTFFSNSFSGLQGISPTVSISGNARKLLFYDKNVGNYWEGFEGRKDSWSGRYKDKHLVASNTHNGKETDFYDRYPLVYKSVLSGFNRPSYILSSPETPLLLSASYFAEILFNRSNTEDFRDLGYKVILKDIRDDKEVEIDSNVYPDFVYPNSYNSIVFRPLASEGLHRVYIQVDGVNYDTNTKILLLTSTYYQKLNNPYQPNTQKFDYSSVPSN